MKNIWDKIYTQLIKIKIWTDQHRKWTLYLLIVFNIFCVLFILSFNNLQSHDRIYNDRIYQEYQNKSLSFIFDGKLEDKILNSEKENFYITLKSMWIGIIVLATVCGWKKSFFGISMGVILGALIGVWIAIAIPHIIYLLELIPRFFNF